MLVCSIWVGRCFLWEDTGEFLRRIPDYRLNDDIWKRGVPNVDNELVHPVIAKTLGAPNM